MNTLGSNPETDPRRATWKRQTKETRVEIELQLGGAGRADVDTGLAFLDHMLENLCRHGNLNLKLHCQGDLLVDDHHTVEDCALAFGKALKKALGDGAGIQRFGSAYAPLDEALARVVIDLSGRPFAFLSLGLQREKLGQVACENLVHWFRSLAMSGEFCLHAEVLRGENDHHRAEATFKAFALALRQATAVRGGTEIPSTKGVLT
ncbi:MAG: imidazoleglycerol-phosphate dehydratase HisB [Planctomycetota bacterium]|nr:MAG: imidazoleglycerol-phosphate dehydratase HisB [Planctomycetota bacterium]